MSVLDTLVTDRVPGDTYGWKDMNRVAEAMEYVAQRLQACGCNVTVDPRHFSREDFPTESVIAHYIDQLRKLHDALPLLRITPPVPDIGRDRPYMTVQEANDIERILLDVDTIITHIVAGWYYSGELYAGEV